MISKIYGILANEGPKMLVWKGFRELYKNLRKFIPPKRNLVYNGVIVNKYRRYSDFLFVDPEGWIPYSDRAEYESGICRQLRNLINRDDEVIIIGGGFGVTAVVAARHVEENGGVTVYEGSEEEVKNVRWAKKKNGVQDRIDVKHAIVGEKISLRGDSKDCSVVKPEHIPQCDILELDCEGSEISILKEMEISPKEIIVETHSMYDAPPEKVTSLLKARGYNIVSKEIAETEPPYNTFCEDNGVYIITAKLDG